MEAIEYAQSLSDPEVGVFAFETAEGGIRSFLAASRKRAWQEIHALKEEHRHLYEVT